MDVKEKLVELLDNAKHKYRVYEENKDHKMRTAKTQAEFDAEANTYEIRHSFYARELIANGVTVQEWISVTDRLPEQFVNVLCYFPEKDYGSKAEIDYAETTNGHFSCSFKWGRPTHWMPLPQPPKGE